MSFHDNYAKWERLAKPEYCPVCHQEPMPSEMVDIVELPNSWLSAEPVDCLKGACHLIAKKHVLEIYEFNDAELLDWMKEVQICAKALHKVTGAVKINYEIHGNSVPHLHLHLYPRYLDDPFPGQPIDYRQKQRWYSNDEFVEFVEKMQFTIHRLE